MKEAQPTVKRSRKDETAARRQQILDAACRMIFERGYEPVSIIEIGAAAGVSGPAIYRHFESKAEILAVLCNQTVDRLIEFVGPRRADPGEELAALVEGQIRLVLQHPELVSVFENEERALPPEFRRNVRRRERDHAGRWVAALRQIDPRARVQDLEILVYAAVGMILSVPRWPRALQSDAERETQLRSATWRILAPMCTNEHHRLTGL